MIKNVKYAWFILALVILEAVLLYKGDLECGKFLAYLSMNIIIFFYIVAESMLFIKNVFLKDMKNGKNIFIMFVYVACLSLCEWLIYLLSMEVYYCLK